MAWSTPKTDWFAGDNLQHYNGDRFTYKDFNRIKNNIEYLFSRARTYFSIDAEVSYREEISEEFIENDFKSGIEDYFVLKDGTNDRTPADYIYADELNYFEYRLDFLNELMEYLVPGEKKTFYPNNIFIDAVELNRLETICATFYDYINNVEETRRRLPFTLSQNANHMDL